MMAAQQKYVIERFVMMLRESIRLVIMLYILGVWFRPFSSKDKRPEFSKWKKKKIYSRYLPPKAFVHLSCNKLIVGCKKFCVLKDSIHQANYLFLPNDNWIKKGVLHRSEESTSDEYTGEGNTSQWSVLTDIATCGCGQALPHWKTTLIYL